MVDGAKSVDGGSKQAGLTRTLVVIAVAVALLAAGWNLRGGFAGTGGTAIGPDVYFFDSAMVVVRYSQSTPGGVLNVARQVELFDQAEELAAELAREAGVVLLAKGAAIHVPPHLDVTDRVLSILLAADEVQNDD